MIFVFCYCETVGYKINYVGREIPYRKQAGKIFIPFGSLQYHTQVQMMSCLRSLAQTNGSSLYNHGARSEKISQGYE
jgi:hypothetical protein